MIDATDGTTGKCSIWVAEMQMGNTFADKAQSGWVGTTRIREMQSVRGAAGGK